MGREQSKKVTYQPGSLLQGMQSAKQLVEAVGYDNEIVGPSLIDIIPPPAREARKITFMEDQSGITDIRLALKGIP
jgi:hypothetical protein